ncbi:MAG TPA: helicase HerA-like domain-containing protein [Solirubrobacteraceae bacterium]|nr:helicase HerA-like domain-containing protein [Solirubrobacteraceae bacterium]
MIPDPPPPRGMRPRPLVWPIVAFLLLMATPPAVALALLGVALVVRGAARALRQARWDAEARRVRTQDGPTVMIGHDDAGRAVCVPERTLAAHGLILGATGAGKSTTLLALLEHQIRSGRGVIAIDLKGSPGFAEELRAAAAAAARPFRLWTPDGPTHWNPLASGNAAELKDKLLGTERFTEPHYRRAAERYLQLAIQVAQESEPGLPVTLARVVELLSPERLVAATRRLPRARAERVREYVAALTGDQLSAVRGLASRLAILSESHTGPLLEPGAPERTLDLRAALDGGDVVLFSLNSSTYGSLAAMLGTLAVQDVISATGARLRERPAGGLSALVAIDEFSGLDSGNVVALLARGREAGVGVLLATQELADLDRVGRGLGDQILGNTALKIAHRQDVPESAERVARLAGTERVWQQGYDRRTPTSLLGAGLGAGWGGRGGSVGTSARLVDRHRVDPERVSTMRTGEALVVIKSPRASAHVTTVRRAPPAREAGR